MTSKYKVEIEAHLAKYQGTYLKRIHLVFNQECQSFGDWLRHIHSERFIEDHFIVIKGSCVTQFNMAAMLTRYEELQKLDKNMLLMKVFTKASTLSDHRTLEQNKYVILDQSDRILYFEEIQGAQFRIKGGLASPRERPSQVLVDQRLHSEIRPLRHHDRSLPAESAQLLPERVRL